MMAEINQGMSFVRVAIAKAVGHGNDREALEYATQRWGASSNPATILRTAVGGMEYGSDALWTEAGQAATAFIEMVRARTILGKLQGLRRVPGRTPIVKQSGQATGYWISEGASVPLSKSAFEYDSIDPLMVAALTVASNELLKEASPAAEGLIYNDLIKAVVTVSDDAFVNPFNAGVVNKTPASITYGVSTLTSSGDIADDVELAISQFDGDLETASWLISPRLAVQMGLRAGARGIAADLGAKGGTLAGLPVITSTACNYQDSDGGHLTLVDAGGIVLLDDGVAEVRISTHATIEMDTEPTGNSLDPAPSTTAMVNMFQTESSAILTTRQINWEVARDNAVVIVAGANYPAGA